MEKKKIQSSNTNLRTNKLKAIVGDEEGSMSWLIGRVVEKGDFDKPPQPPSSFPQPTVLPFPVARHRSHGPHWAPVKTESVMPYNSRPNEEEEDEDDDDKDEGFMDVDSIAAFAKPVQRKQRKVSDISKWREIVKSGPSISKKKEAGSVLDPKKQAEPMDTETYKHSEVAVTELPPKGVVNDFKANGQVLVNKSPGVEVLKAKTEIMEELDRAIPKRLKMKEAETSISCSRFNDSGSQPRSATLLDEINAENLARLREMSPDEIQQAQSEIMEKMNPALLEVLKRRGSNKLKKQNTPITGPVANSGDQNGNQFANHAKVSTPSQSVNSPTETSASTQDAQKHTYNGSARTSGQATGSVWNSWSQRVEMVRHLRFSLDGYIIGNDAVQVPDIGETLASSDYTADNVAERDFLRTEGDPAAAGYTIKEAVALTRSVIPGQRALALHLLASVLNKAVHNIDLNQVGNTMKNANNCDWEAIWAFALGPEPDLILCLRLCLDDNHSSVVLGCAKVIQCILSCDANENFFDLIEKTATYEKAVCTAPVFRSRPKIEAGFLHGELWKYNAKPSNILRETGDEKAEEEHTIQDDISVAGQDIAAGLIRMGILPRMCYLLEAKPSTALEDCLISILIAIARHSPTCASLLMKCQRLVQTVVKRFTRIDGTNIHSAKIKSVTLLKVLAQSDKKNCVEFIENGMFQGMMWHLYRPTLSIGPWIKLGKDRCKAESSLMVEQLRFWKVCIQYGCCLSYFESFFPALCLWLNPPTFRLEAIQGSTSGLRNSSSKLDTIPEESDTSSMSGQDHHCHSMTVEWAHQRLPVPMHWFLSPISNVYDSSDQKDSQKGSNNLNLETGLTGFHEVARGGLFFLLGIESMSSFIPTNDYSPVNGVPLVWKLHCLSVVLLNGMTVLEDEKSRDVYEALQDIYGELLIRSNLSRSTELLEEDKSLVSEKKHDLEILRFQSKIHESYSTFIETFVEQFSAESYGDLLYGRQVAIYLHRNVESPVRLATWKALSNNHVLELLPPLNKCLGNAEGYLEPVEDDEDILEVYAKAWVSGGLDKAATRGSVAFTLVLHHLSSFMFDHNHSSEKLSARNKLAKSLLRDFSRKQQHQDMMLDFIRYVKPSAVSQNSDQNGVTSLQSSELERRLQILSDVCEGNSSLLVEVKKLKSLLI